MAALKEIKARIASVRSTLKITSAMKMVASAKLHRVQGQAQAAAEYERGLSQIAAALTAASGAKAVSPLLLPHDKRGRAVVVAFSSDGSLCGSFNTNAVKALAQQVERLRAEGFDRVTVIPVGGKIAQAAAEAGYDTDGRFRTLISNPVCEGAAVLADALMAEYAAGEADRVVLVYNHFRSMGRQTPVQEMFFPLSAGEERPGRVPEYICEPGAETLLAALLPQTLRARLHAVLLDSITAEQAARTVAMQTASDNAAELLDDLSLTYNKRRQQAITDELADITPAE